MGNNKIAVKIIGLEPDGGYHVELIVQYITETEHKSYLGVAEETYRILPSIGMIDSEDHSSIKIIKPNPELSLPRWNIGDVLAIDNVLGVPITEKGLLTDPNSIYKTAIMLNIVNKKQKYPWKIFKDEISNLSYSEENFKLLGNTQDINEALQIVERYSADLKKQSVFYTSYLFIDEDTLKREADYHRSSLQPDEALLFTWKEGEEIKGSVITHKGPYLFFQCDEVGGDIEDCGIDTPDEVGLFLLSDGKAWVSHHWESECEDDFGLDGKVMKINLQEAINYTGLSEEQLMEKLEEAYPYEHDGIPLMEAIHSEEFGKPSNYKY